MKVIKLILIAVILTTFAFTSVGFSQDEDYDFTYNPYDEYTADDLVWIERSKQSNQHPIDGFISSAKFREFIKTGKRIAPNGKEGEFAYSNPPLYFVYKMKKEGGFKDGARWVVTLGESRFDRFKKTIDYSYDVIDGGQTVKKGSEMAPYYFEVDGFEIIIVKTYIPKYFLEGIHFSRVGGSTADWIDPFNEQEKQGARVLFSPLAMIPEAKIKYQCETETEVTVKDISLDVLFRQDNFETFIFDNIPAGKCEDIKDYSVTFRLWNDEELKLGGENFVSPTLRD